MRAPAHPPTPYADLLHGMQAEREQLTADESADPCVSAFLTAGDIVVQQLAAVERALLAGRGSARELYKAALEPWVINYVVGAAIDSLERRSLLPDNIEDSSYAVVRLVQLVMASDDFQEATALMERAKESSVCEEALAASASDSDDAAEGKQPSSLARWLAARVNLEPWPPFQPTLVC